MNAPCYKCEDRCPACHDRCEKYKEWKSDRCEKYKEWKSIEEKKKEHTESTYTESDEFIIANVMKQQRRRRK